jgi:hypothetical protein
VNANCPECTFSKGCNCFPLGDVTCDTKSNSAMQPKIGLYLEKAATVMTMLTPTIRQYQLKTKESKTDLLG